jgi:glycosyltransferase involved in cell wall biosynthesis
VPKVVVYLHSSSGMYGADRQLLQLAAGLDRKRFTPLVVLDGAGPLAGLLDDAGVETAFAPLATLRRNLVAALVRSRRRVAATVADHTPALVHTNTSIVLGGQAVADSLGVPHVQHIREIYPEPLRPLLRRRLRRAAAVVCVSRAAAAQLQPSERVSVVHDGVVPVVPVARAAARRQLGLPSGTFVVACLGRISDWKGQAVLVRALAEPALSGLDAVGLVAGEPAPGQARFERELRRLAERLGLGDRLQLLGFRDDVETVLGAADAIAVPSVRADSLPNAALEGGSAGLPVVASRIGGLPEIVADGRTGRLVAPGDHHELAEALRALADDPAAAARLGAAAAADVRARFGVQPMLDAVQACYARLTS